MVGCLTWDGGSHGLLCSVHGEDATGIEVWAKPRGMWYALLKNKGVSQSGGQAEQREEFRPGGARRIRLGLTTVQELGQTTLQEAYI